MYQTDIRLAQACKTLIDYIGRSESSNFLANQEVLSLIDQLAEKAQQPLEGASEVLRELLKRSNPTFMNLLKL
jgi:hypothetical protein